ncbi:Prophage tail length tape measure protein [Rhodobacter sp. 24-YEA-8]|nr:Prophage tail length tape measure protein [Rhodobacter sp. 24-YEA-8]
MSLGQSPFMLMMQQGQQVVQVFGQMRAAGMQIGPAIASAFTSMLNPLSFATMAVIGFGAAALQWFTGAGEKAKSLSEVIDELSSRVRAYRSAVDDTLTPMGQLRKEWGLQAEQIREVNQAIALLERIRAIQSMTEGVAKIREGFSGLKSDLDEIATLQEAIEQRQQATEFGGGDPAGVQFALEMQRGIIESIRNEYGLTVVQAQQLQTTLEGLNAAKGPEAQRAALTAMRQVLVQIMQDSEGLPASFTAAAEQIITSEMAAWELEKALRDGDGSARSLASVNMAAGISAAGAQVRINGRASSAMLPFGTATLGTVDAYVPIGANSYYTDADGVYVRRATTGAGAAVSLRATVPSVDGNVYRVTAKVKSSHAQTLSLRSQWLTAEGTSVTGALYAATAVEADTLTTITMIFGRVSGGLVTHNGGSQAQWNNAAMLRFGVSAANGIAASTMNVYEILVDDLTGADAAARSASGAAGSASAAATSASSAAASQTAAGTSASAAQIAQTAAETARGQAQTHATNAATSASNAQGSANAAAISQGAAATSATASGNSATAAAGSASLASTKATEAGTYSAEALDFRNTAARLMSGGVSKNPVFND